MRTFSKPKINSCTTDFHGDINDTGILQSIFSGGGQLRFNGNNVLSQSGSGPLTINSAGYNNVSIPYGNVKIANNDTIGGTVTSNKDSTTTFSVSGVSNFWGISTWNFGASHYGQIGGDDGQCMSIWGDRYLNLYAGYGYTIDLENETTSPSELVRGGDTVNQLAVTGNQYTCIENQNYGSVSVEDLLCDTIQCSVINVTACEAGGGTTVYLVNGNVGQRVQIMNSDQSHSVLIAWDTPSGTFTFLVSPNTGNSFICTNRGSCSPNCQSYWLKF